MTSLNPNVARRLKKEVEELINDAKNASEQQYFKLDEVEDITRLSGVLSLTEKPYEGGKFKICIQFPEQFPFKPPKITFVTPIYHPNVNENGDICLPVISPQNWRSPTKMAQVIRNLVALINSPEPEHAMSPAINQQYTEDLPLFMQKAQEFTKKHAIGPSN